jgi:hypothetical protein
MLAVYFASGRVSNESMIALGLSAVFTTSLVCNGFLAMTRPPVAYLTEFFLLVQFGRSFALAWLLVGGASN